MIAPGASVNGILRSDPINHLPWRGSDCHCCYSGSQWHSTHSHRTHSVLMPVTQYTPWQNTHIQPIYMSICISASLPWLSLSTERWDLLTLGSYQSRVIDNTAVIGLQYPTCAVGPGLGTHRVRVVYGSDYAQPTVRCLLAEWIFFIPAPKIPTCIRY